MADPLADILNRVSANPQGGDAPAQQEPHWTRKLAQAIGAVNTYGNPMMAPLAIAKEALDGKLLENTRMRAGQLARIPTDVAGGAVGLPNLPDTLSQLLGGPKIGRIESLDTASDAIHDAGKSVGEAVAGRPLNDSLLEGDPAELGASWGRLLAGAAIPVPGSWQAKMSSAMQKVSSGNVVADRAAETAVKTLEILTPLTLNPKAAAANVGAASVIAPALELAVGNHNQVAAQIAQGSEQAKGALDVAAQGVKEARDAGAVRTIQAGITTGNDAADTALLGAGLIGAAYLGQTKFNIMGRALNGLKESAVGKKLDAATTGYDRNLPFDQTDHSWWTRFNAQWGNRNLPMQKELGNVLRAGNRSDADVKEIAFRENAAARTGPSVNTRLESTWSEGVLPDSSVRVNPINNFYEQVLTPEEIQLFDRAVLSQREKDTRFIHKQFHDLFNTPTRELEAYITQARANPKISYLMDEYFGTNRKFSEYMKEQKRFSAKEVDQFVKANPNYVASELTDPAGRWLNQRKITSDPANPLGQETFEQLGSPYKLWPQYIDEVVRSTEGMKIKRDTLTEFIRAKGAGNPRANELIGRTVTEAPPDGSAGRFVSWRDANGVHKWTEVKDAAVRQSLQDATNPTALQLHKGLFDILGESLAPATGGVSRILNTKNYQAGAVGAPAALTGSIFAPTSMQYTSSFSSAFRPKGIAASPLDKWVQEKSAALLGEKNKFGVPGDWYSGMPLHVINGLRNVESVLMMRGAAALRSSVLRDGPLAHVVDRVMPRIPMGPNTAQEAADGIAEYYRRIGSEALRIHGIMGPSTYTSVDPALSFQNAEQLLRSKGLVGKVNGAGSFVSDILHAISSAPAVTWAQLNRDAMKGSKAGEMYVRNAIRNMGGDVGASGAYRGMKAAAHGVNTVPWGNVMIQTILKGVNSTIENPKGAAAGIFNAAVVPGMLSALWAADKGREYVDYLFNVRSPDRVSSSFYIAVPGEDPEAGAEISIDPLLRPFKLMGEVLIGAHLGLLDGKLYEQGNEITQQAIKDFVSHRFFSMGRDSVPLSLVSQTLVPPMPGPLQAAGGAFGLPVRDFVSPPSRVNDKHEGGFTEGTGPRAQSYLNTYGPAHMEDIVRGLGAQAGVNILRMLDDTLTRRFSGDMGRSEGNQSWSEAAKQGIMGNAKQSARDSMKMVSPALFDSFLAISPSKEASAVVVQGKLDGLRKFSEAYGSSTIAGGAPQDVRGNKRVGMEPYTGLAPNQAPDPLTAFIAQESARIYRELSTMHNAAIKSEYDDRMSIMNSSKFSPEKKRELMNDKAINIINMNRRLLQDIERYESVISERVGRPVKFDKLNLNNGQAQFK